MGAALHFDIWVPNFGIQEYMRHTPETDAVFPHAYASRTAICIRATRRATASRSTRRWPPISLRARCSCRWPGSKTEPCGTGKTERRRARSHQPLQRPQNWSDQHGMPKHRPGLRRPSWRLPDHDPAARPRSRPPVSGRPGDARDRPGALCERAEPADRQPARPYRSGLVRAEPPVRERRRAAAGARPLPVPHALQPGRAAGGPGRAVARGRRRRPTRARPGACSPRTSTCSAARRRRSG